MEETVGTENIDVRNYFRLLSLLNTTVNAFLRKWFRKNWLELVNSEWEDDGDCRIHFVKGVGQELFSRSKPIQTNCLNTLSINLWDLPLLADAVNCMQGKLGRQKSKHFNGLKAFRNKLMHMGNMEISNEEFKNSWENISVILLSLGIPQMELDVAKTINFKNDVNPKPEDILNEANRKNAENLRKRGNSLFNEKNYEGAIVSYSEAILIPDLPGNYSAVLYANRSLASLKLGDLQAAKGDARGAMHMRPNWWKGYARLANAYQELKKYGKALQYNEIALGIRPTAVDVKDARDFCRLVVAKTARCEHLDPLNFATTFEDTVKRSKEIDGIRTNAYAFTDYQKMNLEVGNPVSICGDGHKYLHGNGVAQNFETAARLYAKAASKGSAEGLYNLAILTDEGKGVKRNILEATRMYFEAAAQEPFVDVLPGSAIKVPNIGVMESQHALGWLIKTVLELNKITSKR